MTSIAVVSCIERSSSILMDLRIFFIAIMLPMLLIILAFFALAELALLGFLLPENSLISRLVDPFILFGSVFCKS